MRLLTKTSLALAASTLFVLGLPVATEATATSLASDGSRACPPAARALGYSDRLDKLVRGATMLGGLSSLAWDRRSHAWVSAVDNHDSDPSRIWFFRNLSNPHVTRDPLVLRHRDGTPYNGLTADNEGLAVLPDGRYLVSSETEPSIRIFDRHGRQRAHLHVPARFRVAPQGQATANATLEGLTISPSGHRIVAAMEGTLSGDSGTQLHRFLVYDRGRHGPWHLTKQVGYRTETGQRIPEVAALTATKLIVEEASYDPTTGNAVRLYEATGIDRARNVARVPDLAAVPARGLLHKRLLANLIDCPTLGAPAKEPQTNPLLDNFEGMAVTAHSARNRIRISLISDDNFSATQTTRVLNLAVNLRR